MAITDPYSTGTASVNNGGTIVTGQGTAFQTAGVRAGDLFWAAGLFVRIASVNSNTSLTLAWPWPGASRVADTYEIRWTPDDLRVLSATRRMLTALEQGGLGGLVDLQTAANKLAYYTGAGVSALTDLTAWARTLIASSDLSAARNILAIRETLTADRTYYVRTDGNDNNTGLVNTAGGAFKTISRAVNVVATLLDLRGFGVTIQVADGTYAENVTLLPTVGHGSITLRGNTSAPGNVVVSSSGGRVIVADGRATRWTLDGLKLRTTGSGALVYASGSAEITLARIDFGGTGGGVQVSAEDGGSIYMSNTTLTISGGSSLSLWSASRGGEIVASSTVVTVTTSFSVTRFVSANSNGLFVSSGVSFSLGGNVITGSRYNAVQGGGIQTGGGGPNYFPGTADGISSSPGWYA